MTVFALGGVLSTVGHTAAFTAISHVTTGINCYQSGVALNDLQICGYGLQSL